MNKVILLIAMILTNLAINAQNITGEWNGLLEVQGMELSLVFHITETEDGYQAEMDSPDQGVKGISVTSISFENSILKLEIKNATIQYEGTLKAGNLIEGTFTQGGYSIPLNLSREKIEKTVLNRPQEPPKPYPYYSEEVRFENKKDGHVLAGTLTLPKQEGVFPVVVLISGSGPQNRDEELLGHKPFLVLADHLTKNGIAVLRFDDRGVAESTGDFKTATSADFAVDVESAIKYLLTRKDINKDQIGLVGHSEGGIIAPMVAVASKDVNFIVLLAGTGIRGDQLLLLQQELIGKASGMSDADLQQTKTINNGAFAIILKSNNTDSLEMKLTNYFKQSLQESPDPTIPEGMSDDEYVERVVGQFINPWMNYFIKYDPSLVLEKVECPVLAINGEKDLQVPPKVNLDAIGDALKKGGNENYTRKELAGLNHLFQETKTGLPSEYGTIEQTFSPVALEIISNWILTQVE